VSWIEVRAELPSVDDVSPFVEQFRAFGIENTQEEGATLSGCIVDVEGVDVQIASLKAALLDFGALSVDVQPFEEQNWEQVWRQYFKPRRVGDRFVVRPTWEEFAAGPEDCVIVLDPGEAFGTGDHPTTRMCLELLEGADVSGKTVADVGCGSGILSIGACLLGAVEVLAVDIEPASVEVTKANAALNEVSFTAIVGEGIGAFYTSEPDTEAQIAARAEWEQDETPLADHAPVVIATPSEIVPRFDLVVSNIISAVLIRMTPDIAAALKPSGRWVVSGIIETNWPEVLSAAIAGGFELVDQRQETDWVAARFKLTA